MSCNFPSVGVPDFPSLDDLFELLLSLIPDIPSLDLPGLPCPLD